MQPGDNSGEISPFVLPGDAKVQDERACKTVNHDDDDEAEDAEKLARAEAFQQWLHDRQHPMITEEKSLVIALVTEDLHRRQIDDLNPIADEELHDPEVGRIWLHRLANRDKLIEEAADTLDGPVELVGELLSFAVTALEMWAYRTGLDPLRLVQVIALGWERDSLR